MARPNLSSAPSTSPASAAATPAVSRARACRSSAGSKAPSGGGKEVTLGSGGQHGPGLAPAPPGSRPRSSPLRSWGSRRERAWSASQERVPAVGAAGEAKGSRGAQRSFPGSLTFLGARRGVLLLLGQGGSEGGVGVEEAPQHCPVVGRGHFGPPQETSRQLRSKLGVEGGPQAANGREGGEGNARPAACRRRPGGERAVGGGEAGKRRRAEKEKRQQQV